MRIVSVSVPDGADEQTQKYFRELTRQVNIALEDIYKQIKDRSENINEQ